MSALLGSANLTAAPRPDAHAQLRRMAHELEGVFLNQLFQAMRSSVPQDESNEAAPGQQLFTSLLDERLAGMAAERMTGGLGEALYRQMARRLPPEETSPTPEIKP
jgi:Rod binding domain-containing protein